MRGKHYYSTAPNLQLATVILKLCSQPGKAAQLCVGVAENLSERFKLSSGAQARRGRASSQSSNDGERTWLRCASANCDSGRRAGEIKLQYSSRVAAAAAPANLLALIQRLLLLAKSLHMVGCVHLASALA